ncbi:outer membrane protein [Yoonia sp.]|uniref:outer membrane protein n=1 Tax=Yoonia sp. TaxID=2212373 RepID=UPI0035C876A2
MRRAIASCIAFIVLATSAFAQVELSFYSGAQTAAPSDVTIRQTGTLPDVFSQDWEGRSLQFPLYYGLRATSWRSERFGFGVDYTRNKIYPTSLPDGVSVLEMTDGLNTLTVNAYHRWENMIDGVNPYVGGGIGIAIPHIAVETADQKTAGYQLTGAAATWIAGATVPINEQWSVFGEYKGTYTANTADLNSGGTLETDVFTNALNVGVSFNF